MQQEAAFEETVFYSLKAKVAWSVVGTTWQNSKPETIVSTYYPAKQEVTHTVDSAVVLHRH